MADRKTAAYRLIFQVFIALAVLTAIEYLMAEYLTNSAALLMIIAFVKGLLIVQYFMHVYRLWRPEEH
jgi:cytochrome c oxidase subunit IV